MPVHRMVRKMKKKRWAAAAASILCLSLGIQTPAYAVGVLAEKVNSGYPEETWARLQDNVLEYDEIPLLIHEFNSTVTEMWGNLEDSKTDMQKNMDELESQKLKMENLRDSAKESSDPGDKASALNYGAQVLILDGSISYMEEMSRTLNKKATLRNFQQVEDQFTILAQGLVISYDSLRKQREVMEQLQKVYDRQYQMTVNKRNQSLATDAEVYKAQTNQLSALSSIQAIDSGMMQIKSSLCTLTGWPADADPEIAPVPQVDLSRLDGINLESDITKAIGNNHTLIEQRNSAQGRTNDGSAARAALIEEGDQKMTIKMNSLYGDVMAKKSAYDAALAGYQGAEKSAAGYKRMLEQSLMSEADYLGAQMTYYQKKSAFEAADSALKLAIETYDWAVKGFADLD